MHKSFGIEMISPLLQVILALDRIFELLEIVYLSFSMSFCNPICLLFRNLVSTSLDDSIIKHIYIRIV